MTDLDLRGKARITKAEGKSEGAGDKKKTAISMKMRLTTDAGILPFFHPTLRTLLFNDDGQPRIPNMDPVKFGGRHRNMLLDVESMTAVAVELQAFKIEAVPVEKVALMFTATAFPTAAQKGQLIDLLGEEVQIHIRPATGLLERDGNPHRAAAPKVHKITPAALAARLSTPQEDAPQGGWPALKNDSDEYIASAAEVIEFNEAGIVCQVALLHVGPGAWVNGILLQLPKVEEHRETPRRMAKPYESRGVAAMDAARFITGECDAWVKRHQKDGALKVINRLRSWAADLAITPKLKKNPEPPAAAAKPPRKPAKRVGKGE